MSNLKDSIRLSLGIIQEQYGNNKLLTLLTEINIKLFKNSLSTNEGELWTRNSFEFEAHVPLLSDLDLTLFSSSTDVAKRLHSERKRFLLIGEINFYHSAIREHLLRLGNSFELARDPIMLKKVPLQLKRTEAEKIVFILRQLLSDQKWLQTFPVIRRKKWRYLYDILNEKSSEVPSNREILKLLRNQQIENDSKDYLALGNIGNEIYKISSNKHWRYLFPQSHIWNDSDKIYISSLSPFQKEILLEQIKWEFWGIGCHFYWIEKEIAVTHLVRLREVAKDLNPSPDILNSMNEIIKFLEA